MARTLIVGFGRSGRDLHLRGLVRMRDAKTPHQWAEHAIGIVEPQCGRLDVCGLSRVEVFSALPDARETFDEDTIVHVCTPPASHLGVVRDAARLGYRRMIVEKPLVGRESDLHELQALVDRHDLAIFVVANWLTSALTARVCELLHKPSGVDWSEMTVSQLKPRFTRSLANPGHETVFEVEIPHQVALSLFLAGADIEVRKAECSEMVVDRIRLPYMGNATITLEDRRGRPIVLHSDLTSPIRQRSVEVTFADGTRTVGYYPATESDNFSQLFTFRDGQGTVEREILRDDPLHAFFTEVYQHFEEDGASPISDVQFNTTVVATISKAKSACGLHP